MGYPPVFHLEESITLHQYNKTDGLHPGAEKSDTDCSLALHGEIWYNVTERLGGSIWKMPVLL